MTTSMTNPAPVFGRTAGGLLAARLEDHSWIAVPARSLVLMNPPFSAAVHVKGRVRDAALRHMRSTLTRFVPGGRLVAITGANCSPHDPAWQDAFADLQHAGTFVFTAAIAGKVFAPHGTAIATRLTVIDRLPAADPHAFAEPRRLAPDVASLLDWILADLPPRPDCTPSIPVPIVGRQEGRTFGAQQGRPAVVAALPNGGVPSPEGTELEYETLDSTPADAVQLSEEQYPTAKRPCSPQLTARALVWRFSRSVMMRRAVSRQTFPVSVGSAPRVVRSNSLMPSLSSSCMTLRLSVACFTLSLEAVPEKLRRSADISAYRSWRISMVTLVRHSLLHTVSMRPNSATLATKID
jgi:hypothetical protein